MPRIKIDGNGVDGTVKLTFDGETVENPDTVDFFFSAANPEFSSSKPFMSSSFSTMENMENGVRKRTSFSYSTRDEEGNDLKEAVQVKEETYIIPKDLLTKEEQNQWMISGAIPQKFKDDLPEGSIVIE